MDENIIFLSQVRNDRERPDAALIKCDDYGREMFLYKLNYEFEGGYWAAELWAYSAEDCESRVAAMRESLRNMGQIYAVIPA